MINIAVCEDDARAAEALIARLQNTVLANDASFSRFDTGEALTECVQSGTVFDFAFLDVDLPLQNGIAVGKLIRDVTPLCIIIFVSNYPQFAIDAYDCEAFHYLLKSCDEVKFRTVIEKAYARYRRNHQKITVKTKDGIKVLNVSDIYCVECLGKTLLYHTKDGTVSVRQPLKDALVALSPFGFCQVHQGYLVNFEKIASVDGCDIRLDNGEKVPISVRKRSEVIQTYLDYLERTM